VLQLFTPSIVGRGNIFAAYAAITAPVIYTATAGVGGPLLWNGSQASGGKGVTAFLLGVSMGVTTASTVAGALGIGGGTGQTAAPTTTTAITLSGPLKIDGPSPQCNVYNVGTVANAASTFLPLSEVLTGALTNTGIFPAWIDLEGAIQVPAKTWAAVLATATLTSAVVQVGLVWLEIPN